MKKRSMIAWIITAGVLLSQTTVNAQEVSGDEISVFIEGEKQSLEVAPIIYSGRTLVPLRGIFEKLGAVVTWNEENKTVTVTAEDNLIEVKIGSYFALKNNKTVKLEAQPIIVEDRAMIPLRFVSEALGNRVEWEQDTKTVRITGARPEEAESEVPVTEVLTYERALELALAHSYEMRAKEIGLDKAEELNSSLFLPLGSFVPSLIVAKDGLRTGEAWAERQIGLTKEAIGFSVRTSLDEIVNLKNDARLADAKTAVARTRLNIAQIKADNGMESEHGLDNARRSYELEVKQGQILQKSLESEYIKLDQLLGIKDSNKYVIADSTEWMPLEELDVEDVARSAVLDDPYIWLQEQQLKNSELGLLLFEYNIGGESYKSQEIDISTAKNTLARMKSDLDKTVRARYNQIRILEANYAVLEQNLGKAQASLRILRVQYDAGMVIELDLKEAELAVMQIENQMNELNAQHEQLKALFSKPYLSPAEYM